MNAVTEQLRKKAKELLETGQVKAVIGWVEGSESNRTTSLVIKDPARCAELVFNRYCFNNLAVFLTRPEIKALGKVALVVKGCDAKSVAGLIQENQVRREDVFILGVACEGQGEPAWPICENCDVRTPKLADEVLGEAGPLPAKAAQAAMKGVLGKLEKMPARERLAFWRGEFDRCLRCYACRAACPLCYCKECIVEKNQPQWIPTSPSPKGNFGWNAIRAMHLAGRCVLCGACARACPVGIPLGAISRLTDKVTQKEFNYRAGMDPAVKPPMRTFTPEDNDSLFK